MNKFVFSCILVLSSVAFAEIKLESTWNVDEIQQRKLLAVGECSHNSDPLTSSVSSKIPLTYCERVKVNVMGRFVDTSQTTMWGLRNKREDKLIETKEVFRIRTENKITFYRHYTLAQRENANMSHFRDLQSAIVACDNEKRSQSIQLKSDQADAQAIEECVRLANRK